MNVSQKLELFQTLVKCGFKEIEVGFPSASNTEFTFNRRLIEENRAPDDVWLQVLVQAREDLIERTVESLVGREEGRSFISTTRLPRPSGAWSSACRRRKSSGWRCAARQLIQDRLAAAQRHRSDAAVFAGKFQRDGSRVRQGNFRSGDGCLAADAGAAK